MVGFAEVVPARVEARETIVQRMETGVFLKWNVFLVKQLNISRK